MMGLMREMSVSGVRTSDSVSVNLIPVGLARGDDGGLAFIVRSTTAMYLVRILI